MKGWKWAEGRPLVLFLLAGGLILFFNLWARSLENHGYLRYAEIAREMVRSGEWVLPRYNGEIYINKPPLLFWLIGIPSLLYGSVTPLIARLPQFFAAWGTMVVVFLMGKKVYGIDRAGLLSGGVLLSCYQFFFQSRLAKTDVLITFFIVLTLYFFLLGYKASGRRKVFYHGLSFFSAGLGILTKGPSGIVIPLLIITIFLIKERRLQLLISKPFLLGYTICVLTVLPWILLFIQRLGLDQSITLIRENRIFSRHGPFYFYFGQIWVQFFPWSLLIPFLFFWLWKERRRLWRSEESFFLIWFITLFLFLTVFKYRAARYLLPVLPPLALMIGGRYEKRFSLFFVPILLSAFLWHGVEISWIRKDVANSHGKVLVEQLKPFLKGGELSAHRLDDSTLEELNFYLDQNHVIPVSRNLEELFNSPVPKQDRLVLMPGKLFESVRFQEGHSLVFIQRFQYKKGELVLVSRGS